MHHRSIVANVTDRVEYFHRIRRRATDNIHSGSCSYVLPVEIGLDIPIGENISHLTCRHYASLVLRVLLRNPGSIDTSESSRLINLFFPESDESVVHRYGIDYLFSLSRTDSRNKIFVFDVLLQSWRNLFHRDRASINWTRFVETGELKLVGATGSSSTDAPSTEDAAVPDEGASPFNLEKLFKNYEDFIGVVRQALQSLSVAAGSGSVHEIKRSITVDDVRFVCYLFSDLFDVFEHVLKQRPVFDVDHQFLDVQFRQIRTALLYERLDLIRRLVLGHKNFSKTRDLLYISELCISPLRKKYEMLFAMDSVDEETAGSRAEAQRLAYNEMFRVHQDAVVVIIHDLVVRYLLRKYFCRDVRYNEAVDVYSRIPFVEDNDLAHFFVFLVNRCLNDPAETFSYTVDDQSVFQDQRFWRRVLAHCASIAPNSFVAQVYTFIVSLHKGIKPFTVHDVLAYVAWLCTDNPWYQFYSSSSVERLRTIEEPKLVKHFSSLYEVECILFYVLIENKISGVNERVRLLREIAAVKRYDKAYANTQHSPSLGCGLLTLPVVNWHTTFQRFFSVEPYSKSINHAFGLVADFFRYIITGELREISVDRIDRNVLSIVRDLVEMRTSSKKSSKSGGSSSNGVSHRKGKRTINDGSSASAPKRVRVHDESGSDDPQQIIQVFTFSIDWDETNCTDSPGYTDVLRKLFHFLNSIFLLCNGQFVNMDQGDFMTRKTSIKSAFKLEQIVWSKDPLLRVYTDIFRDFDVQAFENASRRPPYKAVPTFIIGNSFSSISGENLNFVRVSKKGDERYVIWNLTTRKYEPCAPSLLYLLTIDSNNWLIDDDESYPTSVNDRVNEYVSHVLLNMDEFVSDAQRLDALSMMLYTELITKKRIGESVLGVDDEDRIMFLDRVAKTFTRDIASDDERSTVEQKDNHDRSNDWDKDCPIVSGKYVHFVIDRSEFFHLAVHVPIVWVYEYVDHCLKDVPAAGQVVPFSTSFLQLVILLIQLVRDRRIVHYVHQNNFSQHLSDEVIESSIDVDWLRKQKWTKKTTSVSNKADYGDNRSGLSHSSSDKIFSSSSVTPFVRVLEQQLENIDVSRFVDDTGLTAQSDVPGPEMKDSSLPTPPLSSDDSNAVLAWSLNVDPITDETFSKSAGFIDDLLSEREFHSRLKQLLRDTKFYRWTLDSVCDLTMSHVRQLDDSVLLSAFVSFVYVVRHCSNVTESSATASNSLLSSSRSLGNSLCHSAPRLLLHLHDFFPSRFVVNERTFDLARAMTKWLDERFEAIRPFAVPSTTSRNDGDDNEGGGSKLSLFPGTTRSFTFDDIIDASLMNDRATAVQDRSSRDEVVNDRSEVVRVLPLPAVHDFTLLSSVTKQSVVYFCLVVYIFCDLDTATSYHMLRLIISFLYPGIENKSCVIVRGSSGSGKSQFFELVRQFLNCPNGVLTPAAFVGSMNQINTQLLPIAQNFVCQCDETRRVDNETLKMLISPVPISGRSMHSQWMQSIPIMAKIVFTVNNMFQIVSDDGVQERLHSIFHLSHKHYNLVNKHTDMKRYNCGCSWNLSHQLTEHVYPRDIDSSLFLRGLFQIIHHWSPDQVVRTNSNFVLADQHNSMNIRSWFGRDFNSVFSFGFDSFRRNFRFLENFVFDQQQLTRFRSILNVCCSSSPVSRSIIRTALFDDDDNDYDSASLRRPNMTNLYLRYLSGRFSTNFTKLIVEKSNVYRHVFENWLSVEYLFSLILSPCDVFGFENQVESYDEVRSYFSEHCQHLFLSAETDMLSEVNIDVSLLPCTLDFNLMDVRSSLDAFIKFKHSFVIEFSERPISRDQLYKQLNAFVDEVNMSIEDSAFQVRYKDFHNRFETEYLKFCYRRPDTDVPVPNLWSVRIRRI